MKKFRWGRWVIGGSLIVGLTACAGDDPPAEQASGDDGGNGDEASEEAENGGESTEISFIHWRGEDADVFDDIIDQFEDENPDISVNMNIYPSEEYQSNAQQMLRDGSIGDVFTSFPGSQFEAIQGAGFFEDISDEDFVDNFDEGSVDVGQGEDGTQYALPYQLVFNMPVYNKGMFEDLDIDVPQSWDEFHEMGETLLENDITPIAFPGGDIGPNQFMNSMMMNNAPDEDVFGQVEAGEETLPGGWWEETLEHFQELQENNFFQDNALGTQEEAAISMVANEEAAMLATGSYHMASLKGYNEDLDLDLMAPITVDEDEAQFEGIHTATFMLAVNANSEVQEEAKTFIDFLSQPDVASQYANETGQHLTVDGVDYESEELQETSYWIDEMNTRFQPRFLITNSQVENAVLASIENVLDGESPEAAAEQAQTIIDENID